MDSVIGPQFAHIQSHAKHLNPSSNSLTTEDGQTVKYDYLVVAPGLRLSELVCLCLSFADCKLTM